MPPRTWSINCTKSPHLEPFQPPASQLTLLLRSLQTSSKETKRIIAPCDDPLALVRPTVQSRDMPEVEPGPSSRSSFLDSMDPCDDDPVVMPSLMCFETMCLALQNWRSRFGTCHVPRRCFDAAELGAWVRYIRRRNRQKTLEKWKADRLNLLSFCWEVSVDLRCCSSRGDLCVCVCACVHATRRVQLTHLDSKKTTCHHGLRSAARTRDGTPISTTCATSRRYTWPRQRLGYGHPLAPHRHRLMVTRKPQEEQ